MRDEVISALRSLSDPVHQRSRWGRYEEGVNYYDDLSLNVHILYDDCQVLPDPSAAVGTVLMAGEVEPLLGVDRSLSPLLDELADRPDSDYLEDPRWPSVVAAARDALDAMRQAG
jgi:hypothetical protein